LGRLNTRIEAAGAKVLAIGPRGQAAAALAAKKMGVPYPVLADPGRQAYRAYGFTKSLWIIRQSGTVLIDREGVVRYVHRSINPQNSLDEQALLRHLDALKADG
jgi:peroxiredoxin